MSDPTYEEMLQYLHRLYASTETIDPWKEEAIYWFAANYHDGQSSNLYAALCASKFKPSPSARKPSSQFLADFMYIDLEDHYATH